VAYESEKSINGSWRKSKMAISESLKETGAMASRQATGSASKKWRRQQTQHQASA
jgi:hypothetical protein